VATPLDPSPTEHWNRVYRHREPAVLSEDDHTALCALRHFGGVDGARVLDLGCGTGEYSRFFATRGAVVVAVDRSPIAVAGLRDRCVTDGIRTVHPVVADAFGISALGRFDLVFGSMILHHIEPFGRFVDVLADSMTAGGRAFFAENSSMSRFLVWCREHLVGRFGIPKNSDEDEFPLRPDEVDMLRRRFDVSVEHPRMLLTGLASGYLLHGHADRELAWIDDQLSRFERFRRLSYLQHVLLIAPL
jgi:SAM-dependent methyltransferase